MSKEWLSQYEEISPEDFQTKPFNLYHKEWALITAGTPEKCNSMTISWGGTGTYMSLPITNIYIRQERYTKKFFDEQKLYTVCWFPESMKKELGYMGNHSGKDEDKYAKTGLKPIEIDGTMAIEQATRIMICKKIFDGPIEPKNIIPCENKEKYFDKNNPQDFHTMYMGQVLKILEKKK